MDESWSFLIMFFIIMGFAIYIIASNNNAKYQEQRKKEEELKKDPKYLEQKQLEFAKREKMKAELDKQNVAYCPKCLSTSITLVDKKKGSIKRAAVGGALFGGAGAVVGAMTNKNQERICLKCNHRW